MQRRRTDTGESLTTPTVRVLIVEDDEAYRVYLRSLARRLGCIVVTATDGSDALAKLGEASFDLLLSDLEMPKLNGLDLITHVRVHPTAGTIFAVMITGRGDEQSKLAALSRGYDDYLPKSSSEVEVAARIDAARRLLARHRALDAEVLRWRTLATRDELTGVASRRAFVDCVEEHLRQDRAIAVVMLDLDAFKQINDTSGHLVGDRILRDVGALFLSRTRRDDLVARYGGDEFVFVVVDVSLEEATVVAERFASDVSTLSWVIGTESLRVTATVGVAHSSLLAAPSVDLLLGAADRDLYAKKWLKKNPPAAPETVYEYPPSPEPAKVVRLPQDGVPPVLRRAVSRSEE